MELDKTIYYNKIKSVITLIYFIYVIIWMSVFHVNLPLYYNSEFQEKGNHTMKKGVSLLGGSNVKFGLSAEYISNKFYECYNFGISSEGGRFSEYINFIGNRISSPDIVIYSPGFIWNDFSDANIFFDFLPNYSIISQIKSFLYTPDSNQLNFNSFGDQLEYNCDNRFRSFIINEQKFTSSNTFVVSEIIRRVEKIKNLTHSDKVLIRIPPAYVNISNKKFISQNMLKRIKSLKESGIIVVGGTICSSDKSLFCDNFHPNDKGRKFFSIELKNDIKKILIGH